jgi:hypothetical protein
MKAFIAWSAASGSSAVAALDWLAGPARQRY